MAVGWRSGPSVERRPRGKVAGRSMAEASHIGKQGRLAPKRRPKWKARLYHSSSFTLTTQARARKIAGQPRWAQSRERRLLCALPQCARGPFA